MESRKAPNSQSIELLDVVALAVDLPEYNLYRGQVGTVVETLAKGTANASRILRSHWAHRGIHRAKSQSNHGSTV